MVYYRTDLLKQAGMQPPKTWDDYLAIAKAFNGKDLNGDGKPDYGSCIAKKRNAQSYWMVTSVAGNYIQSKGTAQGAFFDTETMKPLIDNDAFKAALKVYTETTQYGPPDEINLDVGDTRGPLHHRPLRAQTSTGATSARSPSTRRPPRCRTRSAP